MAMTFDSNFVTLNLNQINKVSSNVNSNFSVKQSSPHRVLQKLASRDFASRNYFVNVSTRNKKMKI